MEFLPKIQEYAGKLKSFLPNIIEYEKTILTPEEKEAGAKVIYCGIVLDNKIFLLVNVMQNVEGQDVLVRMHSKFELFKILENPADLIAKLV